MEYEFEKYKCSSDNLKETLEKYGIAIIPIALTIGSLGFVILMINEER